MFRPYCSTVTVPQGVCKKMWSGDESTQYLVSFPGHSQMYLTAVETNLGVAWERSLRERERIMHLLEA